jgi:hypothetical protein
MNFFNFVGLKTGGFLEKWVMQLWDLAFPVVFKDVTHFKKNDVFSDYRGVTLLMKRVIYR